jgi:two-component system, cell cycle sensor histidine kinase and response regulator CckA
MNNLTIILLATSIILQLTAALFALRLNKRIKKIEPAWLLIAAALILMSARRIVTLLSFFVPQVESIIRGPMAESIALLISAFMLGGVVLIPRIFNYLHQATKELQASEARYRILANNVKDVIWTMDLNLNNTYISPSIQHLRGYSVEEAMSQTLEEALTPASYELAMKIFQREMLLEQEPHKDLLRTRALEFENRCKDGSLVWTETQVTFLRDSNNNPVGIIGVSRDISERKQAEELATRFGKILDDSLNEIYIFDAYTYQFIQVNQGAQENLGYSITELENMTPLDIKPEFTPVSFAKLLKPLQTGDKEKIQFTTIHMRKDKSMYPIEAHIQLTTSGKLQAYVAIILDITERKRVEEQMEQQARLAAVGQLAAGIAHDFNNMMAVITLYTQLLLKTQNLTKKAQKYLDVIYHQSNRAAELTEQILDFSRQTVMERRPLDLKLVIKDFTEMLERMLPEAIQVKLIFETANYTVNADLTRLQQVIMNLAINARDAMPNGGELIIGLSRFKINQNKHAHFLEMYTEDCVKITVTDTGNGIPAHLLPHLFEPFFTTKSSNQGSGLGLAQVYGIVKQHDGHIEVESKINQGVTFTIYLPAMPLIAPMTEQRKSKEITKGCGETILVVEDNSFTRDALFEALISLNYQVQTVEAGQEALALLKKQQNDISLVLSDMMMPEMDGFKLLQAMKQWHINTPLVMMSGHPSSKTIEQLQAEGVKGWLSKPIALEKLAKEVAIAISGDEGIDS